MAPDPRHLPRQFAGQESRLADSLPHVLALAEDSHHVFSAGVTFSGPADQNTQISSNPAATASRDASIVVDAARSNPNGVTLSLDEKFLFVTDGQGLWRYPVNTDGSTGTATRIAQSAIGGGGDGMGIDCAGNLYVALQQKVFIVDPTGTGTSLGINMTAVQAVTNVAFGGANHQTLYVSGLGNGMGGSSMGLYRADMPLPGMPY